MSPQLDPFREQLVIWALLVIAVLSFFSIHSCNEPKPNSQEHYEKK